MHDHETTYGGSCRSATLARVGRIVPWASGVAVGRVGHWAETTRIPAGQQGEEGVVEGDLRFGIARCAKIAGCSRSGRGRLAPYL